MNRWVTATAAAATTAGMVAFPLAARGGGARRAISGLVVGGLAATTGASAVARWGAARAALAASVVGVASGLVEHVGTATGRPFGAYRYSGLLRPSVAGVPVIVPAAWWAMALPAREAAAAALGRRSAPGTRIAVGAAALTAWDLFLDPQMTAEGYWRWARPGRYRGIPLTNYAGWLLTGAAIMAVLELALPPAGADAALVAEYAGMAVMETVGFAAFFGDLVVAAAGGGGMLPIAALAVLRVVRG
jgi:putative membrane protein